MSNDNKVFEPAIYISLDEAEKQGEKHKGNPIIQQLVFLMRERDKNAEQPNGLTCEFANVHSVIGNGRAHPCLGCGYSGKEPKRESGDEDKKHFLSRARNALITLYREACEHERDTTPELSKALNGAKGGIDDLTHLLYPNMLPSQINQIESGSAGA